MVIIYLFILGSFPFLRALSPGRNVCSSRCHRGSYYTYVYYRKCGIWDLKRCTTYQRRYQSMYYTCYSCCTGWHSSNNIDCSIPICYNQPGSGNCYNGGTCVSPNHCVCSQGFYSPRCNRCNRNIANCNSYRCSNAYDQTCVTCVDEFGGSVQAYQNLRSSCKQLCSWRRDSKFCFPGVCRSGGPSSCQCLSGFSGSNCKQIVTPPSVTRCEMRLLKTGGSVQFIDCNHNDVSRHTKTGPDNINFQVTYGTQFAVTVPSHYRTNRPYLGTFKVGIISSTVRFQLIRGGTTEYDQTHTCWAPSLGGPKSSLSCDTSQRSLASAAQTGDRLKMTLKVITGGFLDIKEYRSRTTFSTRREAYQQSTRVLNTEFTFDYTPPKHCSVHPGKCSLPILNVGPQYTTKAQFTVSWDGWTDPVSGIKEYVYKLYKAQKQQNQLDFIRASQNATVSAQTTSVSLQVSETGVYAFVLEAVDAVENVRYARKFLFYDAGTTVETVPGLDIKITSATKNSAGELWQTNLNSQVTVVWTGYFRNQIHAHNGLLLGIEPKTEIESAYDVTRGQPPNVRSRESINNVNGIIGFFFANDTKNSTRSLSAKWLPASLGLAETYAFNPPRTDGMVTQIWIKAKDVMNHEKVISKKVFYDSSPPVISRMGLARSGANLLSVHHSVSLFLMRLEFEAFDKQSGLKEIDWALRSFQNASDVFAQGKVAVRKPAGQNALCSLPDCYCTVNEKCYFVKYIITPTAAVRRGSHDEDFMYELTVHNWAGAVTVKKHKISIDLSAAQTGVVIDDIQGLPDLDFQQGSVINASWTGFVDEESGINRYQYIFGSSCATVSDFGFESHKTAIQTTSRFASWTAPSVGTYFCTVVAYNHALEPSLPVCSDGVTIDNTPPSLTEIQIGHSHVRPGLVKDSGGAVWMMNEARILTLLKTSHPKCLTTAYLLGDVSSYPKSYFPNGTLKTVSVSNKECAKKLPGNADKIYLKTEKRLEVSWNGIDAESGIFEFTIRITRTASADSMDIEPKRNVRGRKKILIFHPNLNEGAQFYIRLLATNLAGMTTAKVVGPVIVDVTPPDFRGKLHVSLVTLLSKKHYLKVQWNKTDFFDSTNQDTPLTYSVGVGHTANTQDLLSFSPLNSYSDTQVCPQTFPPTCSAIPVEKLTWKIHGNHDYYVHVKVENVAALSVVATADAYHHYLEAPHSGVVMETNETYPVLPHKYPMDIDFQDSLTDLYVRWWGFSKYDQTVSYRISLGTTTGSSDILSAHNLPSNSSSYHFENLTLSNYKKYYTTLEAYNNLGRVVVTTDGVTILPRGDNLSAEVQVYDGLLCPRGDSNLTALCGDIDFQASTSAFMTYWSLSERIKKYISRIVVSVDKENLAQNNTWTEVLAPKDVSTADYLIEKMSLENGGHYRSHVQFCHTNDCFISKVSDGVWILSDNPVPGRITSTIYDDANKHLHFRWQSFINPRLPKAANLIEFYEWNIAERRLPGQPLVYLFRWQKAKATEHSSQLMFTAQLKHRLKFSRCLLIVIRGFNKVGHRAQTSHEIHSCSSSSIKPNTVIDAVGERNNNDTVDIKYTKNSLWAHPDREYTFSLSKLSAVWPTLQNQKFQWKVVTDDSLEHWGGITPGLEMTYETYMCSDPRVLRCGTTSDNFVSVGNLSLAHGRHYHICIHAMETVLVFPKENHTLPSVSACSDGIVVDVTPPVAGKIILGWSNDQYQASNSELYISWDPFTDVEEEHPASPRPVIAHYQFALGTVPNGVDVKEFTDVSHYTFALVTGIHLHDGQKYFATIRATDYAGLSTEAVSSPITVDSTRPVLTRPMLHLKKHYISARQVTVSWDGLFADEHSGIKKYQWCFGSKQLSCDVVSFTDTDMTAVKINLDQIGVHQGNAYYLTIKAFNGAGLSTMVSSWGTIIDRTAPAPGHVFDVFSDKDGDFQTADDKLFATLKGFHDPHSPITSIKLGFGSCPGCDNVLEFSQLDLMTEINITGISLKQGVRYYTTVSVCNAADLCTMVTSDGFIVDHSAPRMGVVIDGIHAGDIDFQASGNYLAAHWSGFRDVHSGLSHYIWRVGTSPAADDILQSRNVYLEERAFTTNIHLPLGKKIYSTVRAYNKAGLYCEAVSDGFIVSTSRPSVTGFSFFKYSLPNFKNFQVSLSSLAVQWHINSSDVEEQILSIYTHHPVKELLPEIKLFGSLQQQYTFTNLHLSDAMTYFAQLTLCDRAKNCQVFRTAAGVTVDNSRPLTGMFAIVTDHALSGLLNRSLDEWMVYNVSASPILKLAWVGFQDPHTDIHSYLIAVGTGYDQRDLLKDGREKTESHRKNGRKVTPEGPVQSTEIELSRPLSHNETIYISVIALNQAGLKSYPLHGSFVVQQNVSDVKPLLLKRQCEAVSCAGHCTCAAGRQRCRAKRCQDVQGSDAHEKYKVIDVANFADLGSDKLVNADVAPFRKTLAAQWNPMNTSGKAGIRFEWTIGSAGNPPGSDIFNLASDQIWHDAGQDRYAVCGLSNKTTLQLQKSYVFYVRVWYNDSAYVVFQSDGLKIDYSHPELSSSFRILETEQLQSFKDIDFTQTSDAVNVSWRNVFIDGQSKLTGYRIGIGTFPGGSNIATFDGNVSTTSTTITAALPVGKKYFSCVLTQNEADLANMAISDGIMVDQQQPEPGVVWDGKSLSDIDCQSNTTYVAASWHGFFDAQSFIDHYEWCVGSSPGTFNLLKCRNVGLSLSSHAALHKSITSGYMYYSTVYAVDSSGLKSKKSVSDGVMLDTSPPQSLTMSQTGSNLIQNPSFDDKINPVQFWSHQRHGSIKILGQSKYLQLSGSISQSISTVRGSKYHLQFQAGYISTFYPHHGLQLGLVSAPGLRSLFMLASTCDTSECSSRDVDWKTFKFSFLANAPTSVIAIKSLGVHGVLALDKIKVQIVNTSSDFNGTGIQTSFSVLGGEIVVRATWDIIDVESGIKTFMWAIGTAQGGTQLQQFQSVFHSTSAVSRSLSIDSSSLIHVTVVAENRAGLASVFYSKPMIFDASPPALCCVQEGPYNDVDYLGSARFQLQWEVYDGESGISLCVVRIGHGPGRSDIAIVSVNPPSNRTDIDLHGKVNYLDRIYSTVKCWNGAGLSAKLTSDGATMLLNGPNVSNAQLHVVQFSKTHYSLVDVYQPQTSQLQLAVRGLQHHTELGRTKVTLQSVSRVGSYNLSMFKEPFLRLSDLPLSEDATYTAQVQMYNGLGVLTGEKSARFSTLMTPPTLTGSPVRGNWRNQTSLEVDFSAVFTGAAIEFYELSLGTRPAHSDVLKLFKTKVPQITISGTQGTSKFYGTVTAVNKAALYTTHVFLVS